MNGRESDLFVKADDAGAWGFGTASRLLEDARDSVAWVPPAVLGENVAPDVAATAGRLAQLSRGGVSVRVLCPDAVATQREYVALLTSYDSALSLRVSRHHWPEHLLVDERVALLRAEVGAANGHGTAGEPAGAAVTVRAHPVVTTLAAVFHAEWAAAVALPEPGPAESRLATEPARRILGLLGAGYRDAAAASELGLSIRTYRRHVAELMSELGAGSRFQAGVRAAHLGLLPPERAAS
jgi:DNA-binding CsgD family transcriptional regulator